MKWRRSEGKVRGNTKMIGLNHLRPLMMALDEALDEALDDDLPL